MTWWKFLAVVIALSSILWNIFGQYLIITQGSAVFVEPNRQIAWLEMLLLIGGGYAFLKMINEPEKKEEKDENGESE